MDGSAGMMAWPEWKCSNFRPWALYVLPDRACVQHHRGHVLAQYNLRRHVILQVSCASLCCSIKEVTDGHTAMTAMQEGLNTPMPSIILSYAVPPSFLPVVSLVALTEGVLLQRSCPLLVLSQR